MQVKEVSKGMIGRYLKKVPASAADAGRKSSGAMGIGPEDQKKQMKKGIKQFVNRQKERQLLHINLVNHISILVGKNTQLL